MLDFISPQNPTASFEYYPAIHGIQILVIEVLVGIYL
jgi:hypothetical protein